MGLFDRFRSRAPALALPEPEPVEVSKASDNGVPQMPRTPPTKPVGSNGLMVHMGSVSSHEKSPDMSDTRKHKTYAEIERLVGAVGAAVRAFLLLCGAPTWTVKPYKADDEDDAAPEDEERAAWLARQIKGIEGGWGWHVMSGCQATLRGASLGAWQAKPATDAGARFGLADIVWLPLSTISAWDVDQQGKLHGVVQDNAQTGARDPIARSRLIYIRDMPTTNHPAGDGALRFVAEGAREYQALTKLLLKGFEKDVNGIPVVHGPLKELRDQIGMMRDDGTIYTAADFARETEHLFKFVDADKRKDAGLVFDSGTFPDIEGNPSPIRKYDAKVLQATSTSHETIMNRLNDVCWYMLAALGFEYLAMGRANGTQAMHVSKSANAIRVVSSALRGFSEAFTRDVTRPLWILNGFDPASPTDPQNMPTLEWDALELSDVEATVNALSQLLASTTVEPGRADDIVNAVLSNLGLPRLEHVDETAALGARQDMAQPKPGPIDPNEPATIIDDTPDPEGA